MALKVIVVRIHYKSCEHPLSGQGSVLIIISLVSNCGRCRYFPALFIQGITYYLQYSLILKEQDFEKSSEPTYLFVTRFIFISEPIFLIVT